MGAAKIHEMCSETCGSHSYRRALVDFPDQVVRRSGPHLHQGPPQPPGTQALDVNGCGFNKTHIQFQVGGFGNSDYRVW